MLINLTPYILIGIKIVVLILLALYSVFSLIVVGKVKFLSRILETEVSPTLFVFVAVNLIISLGLFFVALVVL